ncbi:hypothetical protein HGRIS_014558 [Hohenbuehelia grisea]|uniref:Uncharacterized protein n=1 Tax=Hohenbuehelia grisea TaxID=104357 RepID=A0ABR3JVZ3_9AGAR
MKIDPLRIEAQLEPWCLGVKVFFGTFRGCRPEQIVLSFDDDSPDLDDVTRRRRVLLQVLAFTLASRLSPHRGRKEEDHYARCTYFQERMSAHRRRSAVKVHSPLCSLILNPITRGQLQAENTPSVSNSMRILSAKNFNESAECIAVPSLMLLHLHLRLDEPRNCVTKSIDRFQNFRAILCRTTRRAALAMDERRVDIQCTNTKLHDLPRVALPTHG